MLNRAFILLVSGLVSVFYLAGCGSGSQAGAPGQGSQTFKILAGSENKADEEMIKGFGRTRNMNVEIEYLGSIDLMNELDSGKIVADAVWPANSLWIKLGDTKHLVRDEFSVKQSPVVFGIKLDRAKRLGWVGKDVSVDDILAATERGDLRYMMTSASQSNSGASAYLSYLYAFAGSPPVLTSADLAKPILRGKIKKILRGITRSSGSSGALKDDFLQKYDTYDAMVNYEALIIEANQELERSGRQPLYVVYPRKGLAIANSPLGYVDRGDAKKRAFFGELKEFLKSADALRQISSRGWRIGEAATSTTATDPSVFRKDWGIDSSRVLQPIRLPTGPVIREALDLYQTAFRKPSYTVFLLDYSPSMESNGGRDQLISAVRTLLEPESARRLLLQPTPDDVIVVIPFARDVLETWTAKGNRAEVLQDLLRKIQTLPSSESTNLYAPSIRGLELAKSAASDERYLVSIVLMTDGESNTGSFAELESRWTSLGKPNIPIHAITFGSAERTELDEICRLTGGHIFDGSQDLVKAFREVKGYN